MDYDVICFLSEKLAYIVLGVLSATLAGSLGYIIWLFLGRGAAKFYIKNAVKFLKLLLACYVVPILPFLAAVFLKGTDAGGRIPLVLDPMKRVLAIFFLLWLVAVVLMLIRGYSSYSKKKKLCTYNTLVQNPTILAMADKWKQRLGIKRDIPIYYNSQVASPAIIYNRCYQILLPIYPMADDEINIALLHELMHFKHGDIVTKVIAFLVNIMHAFNPITYWLRYKISRWIEVACDFASCEAGEEEFSRSDYFHCVLDLRERSENFFNAQGACYFLEEQRMMDFRVDMMSKMKGEQLSVPAWSFVLTFFLMLFVTAGSWKLSSGAVWLWFEGSLVSAEKEEMFQEEYTEMAVEDLFADAEIFYSDKDILNQEQSTDFTLAPGDLWIFDVSEHDIDEVSVFVECADGGYSVGCAGEYESRAEYIDSSGAFIDFMELDDDRVQMVFIKNTNDKSIDVELLVLSR